MSADDRIGLGTVIASEIAGSNCVHSDHCFNKSDSKGRDRLGAIGAIDTHLTEGLAVLTGAIHQVISDLTAHADCGIGCSVHHAGFTGGSVGTNCTGVIVEEVEERVTGSTGSCIYTVSTARDALDTCVVRDKPSSLTSQTGSCGSSSA